MKRLSPDLQVVSWISLTTVTLFLVQILVPGAREGLTTRSSSTFGQDLVVKYLVNSLFLISILLIAAFLAYSSRRWTIFSKTDFRLSILFFVVVTVTPVLLKLINISGVAKFYMDIFRIGFINSSFADLRIILVGIGCETVKKVGDPITCTELGEASPNWIYPSALLVLREFGVDDSMTVFLATLMLTFFILALYRFAAKVNSNSTWVLTLIVVSPATFLLIERMNIDILVLSLLFLASFVFNFGKYAILVVGLLLSIASLIKYYAFASFISLFLLIGTKRIFFPILAASSALFIVLLRDIKEARPDIPGDTVGAFGWRNTVCMFTGCNDIRDFSQLQSTLLLLLVLIVIPFFVAIYKGQLRVGIFHKDYLGNVHGNNFEYFFFLFSAPVALTYWILTSNYWYRLTITLFCLYALSKLRSDSILIRFVLMITVFTSYIPMGSLANVSNLLLAVSHLTILFNFLSTLKNFWPLR